MLTLPVCTDFLTQKWNWLHTYTPKCFRRLCVCTCSDEHMVKCCEINSQVFKFVRWEWSKRSVTSSEGVAFQRWMHGQKFEWVSWKGILLLDWSINLFVTLSLSLSHTHTHTHTHTYTQPSDPQYAGQAKVYQDIGKEMLLHAFEGWGLTHCIHQGMFIS